MSYEKAEREELIKTLLTELEYHYDTILKCASSSTRRNHAQKMISILSAYPETKNYWEYNENACWYSKKFCKKECPYCIKNNPYPEFKVENGKVKEDGINYCAPKSCGIYLIGQTAYTPYIKKPYYAVKVGKADWFPSRLKTYNTYCPFLFRIDFKECYNNYEEEFRIHKQLAKIAFGISRESNEWFLVDEETYLAICEKGFSYFN